MIAELFNVNELGEDKKRFRPNAMEIMAPLDDLLKLQYVNKSWESKWIAVKMVTRTIFAKLTGKHYVLAGGALQGRMFQASLKAGVEFLTDTPVTELIVEDGAVKGIVMLKNGKPCRVGARLGVLVNAGGFSHNQAMRDQYQPGTQAKWTNTAEGDTGEMIVEMMRHGAAIGQMEEMVGNQMSFPPGTENDPVKPVVQGVTAAPHCILVDQSGVRYMNEGGSYMAYCKGMLERNREVPAVPSYAIMDHQFMKQYMLAGTLPGSKKPANWFTSGFLKRADSIEELSALINVAPEALRGTVDRFNGFVAKNHDDDFNRGDRAYDKWLGDPFHEKNPSLGSISEGPFYAMAVVPGDVGTYGGVVTDSSARVLREDGSVIEGLYATGISTASSMGRVYPGAGASVGPSFVWGYVRRDANLMHLRRLAGRRGTRQRGPCARRRAARRKVRRDLRLSGARACLRGKIDNEMVQDIGRHIKVMPTHRIVAQNGIGLAAQAQFTHHHLRIGSIRLLSGTFRYCGCKSR